MSVTIRSPDVRLRVINTRSTVAPFYSFNIIWPTTSPPISLKRVVVGGDNANDVVPSGSGVVIWQNNLTSGGDAASPTNSQDPADGTFLQQYIFPPNSVTLVHLDFTGLGANDLSSVGAFNSAFNGSSFEIGCNTTGGNGGGGGGGNSGTIFLNTVVPPHTHIAGNRDEHTRPDTDAHSDTYTVGRAKSVEDKHAIERDTDVHKDALADTFRHSATDARYRRQRLAGTDRCCAANRATHHPHKYMCKPDCYSGSPATGKGSTSTGRAFFCFAVSHLC